MYIYIHIYVGSAVEGLLWWYGTQKISLDEAYEMYFVLTCTAIWFKSNHDVQTFSTPCHLQCECAMYSLPGKASSKIGCYHCEKNTISYALFMVLWFDLERTGYMICHQDVWRVRNIIPVMYMIIWSNFWWIAKNMDSYIVIFWWKLPTLQSRMAEMSLWHRMAQQVVSLQRSSLINEISKNKNMFLFDI